MLTDHLPPFLVANVSRQEVRSDLLSLTSARWSLAERLGVIFSIIINLIIIVTIFADSESHTPSSSTRVRIVVLSQSVTPSCSFVPSLQHHPIMSDDGHQDEVSI
jgi:hypothetical protein